MRRRTWLVMSIAIITIVGALALVRTRHDAFERWPRYAMAPDLVPRGDKTRIKVVDEQGPVAGAVLQFRWRAGDGAGTVTVGQDGTAELPTPRFRLVFATDGTRVSRVAWIGAEVPPQGVELRLLPAAPRLELSVFDEANEVVADAEVSVFWTGDRVVARTSSDGVAKLGPLPPGVVDVRVVGVDGRRGTTSVALRDGALTRAEIRLEPSCSLEGSVIDDQHDPIADAGVELLSLVDDATLFSTRTDEQGAFAFVVNPSSSFVVKATAGGRERREAVQPGCRSFELYLPPQIPSVVELRDTHGTALPRAKVRVDPVWRSAKATAWKSGETDATGRFGPLMLDGEPWVVRVEFDGYTVDDRWTPSLAAPLHTVTIDFETRRVTGHVVDARTRSPISGAHIGQVGQSEADGSFDVRLAGEGRQKRSVVADGYFPATLVSNADAEDVTIALERTDWGTGQVVDEQGVPISNFEIDGELFFTVDGRFVVSLPKSSVRVSAWGFESLELEAAQLLGAVVLRRAKPLTVSVLGPDGGPLAAELWNGLSSPQSTLSALRKNELFHAGSTDRTGQGLVFPAAGFCLVGSRQPFLPSSCELADGGSLVLRLSEASKIEGVVIGTSLARLDVDDEATALTNVAGRFELAPLSAGKHTLRVRMPSGDSLTRAVDVDAGSSAWVMLSEISDVALMVEVGLNDEQDVRLVLTQGATTLVRDWTWVDTGGLVVPFEFTSLTAGPLTITATQGRETRTAQLTLSPLKLNEVKLDLDDQ